MLAGAAEAFSAGADLKDAASWQLAEKTDVQRRHRFYAGGRLCKAWEEMPQISSGARCHAWSRWSARRGPSASR